MTVLDTFFLLFKTDIPTGVRQDVDSLDKQISALAAKGKKRSDEEQKELKELRKRRQESIQDLKDTRQEADKLGDSFSRLIEGAVGAAAAYTSFGFLKSGLIDANKLNVSLVNLQKTTGQNAQDVKAYGAALEQAGGNAQDLYAFVSAQGNLAAQARTPFDFKRLLENLHQQVKNDPQFLTKLQQVPGAVPLIPLLRSSDEEFHARIQGGYESARLGDADAQAALKNQEAFARTRSSFDTLATQIDTNLLHTIERLNTALQGLAQSFEGHPDAALGTGLLAAGGSGWAITKLLKGVGGLLGSGSSATATATAPSTASAGWLSELGFSGLWGSLLPEVDKRLYDSDPKYRKLMDSVRGKSSSAGASSNKEKILGFWQSQGYSSGAAAGWTANAQRESSFDPLASNGSHFGIYQWSRDRRAKILAGTNIDVATAGLDDQLKAAAWEAGQMGLTPDRIPNDPRGAAALISNRYEVPALTASGLAAEASRRGDIAAGYGIIPAAGSLAGGGRTVNVKIDDIRIETQATDAKGIAGDVSAELKNQIRLAMSNFDDGVNY